MGAKDEVKGDEGSYVKACPRCSSQNLAMEPGISIYLLFGHIYQYRCHDCGYFGPNYDLVNKEKDYPVKTETL